jgi:hypothetical protein
VGLQVAHLFNEEGTDALGTRLPIGARHDQIHICRAAAADECLVACAAQAAGFSPKATPERRRNRC